MAWHSLSRLLRAADTFSALCLKTRCRDEHGADQRHGRPGVELAVQALAGGCSCSSEAQAGCMIGAGRSLVRCSRL